MTVLEQPGAAKDSDHFSDHHLLLATSLVVGAGAYLCVRESCVCERVVCVRELCVRELCV